MEYIKKNLLNREELAKLVMDTYQALTNYKESMHNGSKDNVRDKAHTYYRKRDELVEAARSILFCATIKDE